MMIKELTSLLALIAGFITAFSSAPHPAAFALSKTEADALVATRMTAQIEHEEQQRAQLKKTPALQEWTVERDDRKTLFRRIAPPSPAQPPVTIPKTNAQTEERGELPAPVLMERGSQKNFTLFITVFGETTTEIRSQAHPGFTAILEEDFSSLPAFLAIETDETVYSFFSFIQRVDMDASTTLTPSGRSPLPSADSKFVIHSESGSPAPDAFNDMISLLREHLLEHKEQFEADARRAEALRLAGERYPPPPEPPETVINFWPIRNQPEEN